MIKTFHRVLPLFATALMLSASFAGVAAAADDALDETIQWAGIAEEIDEAPGYNDSKDSERKWAFSIGVTSGFSPDYEGSNDYSFGYSPNISASWRDTIFYKGRTLGANLIRQKNLKAGLMITKSSGRSEDCNDKLDGLGDVDGSIEAGGFVSFRKKPYRFKAEVKQDVGSGHEGALVYLGAGTNLPFENLPISIELGATWASSNYMESFFGIDAQQSLDSGLKQYNAGAGIKDIKLSMTTGYPITKRWRIGAAVEYHRLVGDAADSPIVVDKNQFLAGISLSYHMGSKFPTEDLQ